MDNETSIFRQIQQRWGIIGNSAEIQEAVEKVWQVAPTDITVLITGETGTGKEVFANAIHGLSVRKEKPFISVNCGAIPENLLESELFGHEKGAFTGANDSRVGFFESAHKGTIFLDEIGEMPLQTQVKLLRVLENGEYSRLGSSKVHKVDVRIIAATNRDLKIETKNKKFREDLFFRLNSVHIILPSLRQRREDIPLIADFFATRTSINNGYKFNGFSDDALLILKSMPWKGNVRELRNLIETIIKLENADYIDSAMIRKHSPQILPPYQYKQIPGEQSIARYDDDEEQSDEIGLIFRTLLEIKSEILDIKKMIFGLAAQSDNLSRKIDDFDNYEFHSEKNENDDDNPNPFSHLTIDEVMKKLIIERLEINSGNRRKTASDLGISERTLYRKLNEYGID